MTLWDYYACECVPLVYMWVLVDFFSLTLFPFSLIFDDYFLMRERARKGVDLVK